MSELERFGRMLEGHAGARLYDAADLIPEVGSSALQDVPRLSRRQ
jgi:hypothetical protein